MEQPDVLSDENNTDIANPRISRHRSTAEVLHDITCFHEESISVRDLSAQLGDRGFGLIILLFALPNTIPLPLPGISTLTGLPMIFFSAQLCYGNQRIMLPSFIANRQISMATLRPTIRKTLPILQKLEKTVKPRLDKVTTRGFERFAGALILMMALLIALPIPLGNLPLGIAMAILALAITERDGVVMIIGWIATILALCFLAALVSGYAFIAWKFIDSFL